MLTYIDLFTHTKEKKPQKVRQVHTLQSSDTAKNAYQREITSKNSYQRETPDKNSFKRDAADKIAYQRDTTNQNSHQRETMTINAGNDRNPHTAPFQITVLVRFCSVWFSLVTVLLIVCPRSLLLCPFHNKN